jgi:hypothetical protein
MVDGGRLDPSPPWAGPWFAALMKVSQSAPGQVVSIIAFIFLIYKQASCSQLEDSFGRFQTDYDEARKALESFLTGMADAFVELQTGLSNGNFQICSYHIKINEPMIFFLLLLDKSEADGEVRHLNERLQDVERKNNEAAREWQLRLDNFITREKGLEESIKHISNDKETLTQQLSQTSADLSIPVVQIYQIDISWMSISDKFLSANFLKIWMSN